MDIKELRKKLKPTSNNLLEERDKELNKKLGKKGGQGIDDDFISFEPGSNMFRVLPPHEGKSEVTGRYNAFAEPCVTAFVPAIYQERDSSDEVIEGKFKESVKRIFNSRIHGKLNKEGDPLTKDIIEEYIKMAYEKARGLSSDDERDAYLLPIKGRYSKIPEQRVNGIEYQARWVMYVVKLEGGRPSELGRLDIGRSVKDRLNKISAIESENQPLGTDPFTDIEEGRAVNIIYNPDAKKSTEYYTTELDNNTAKEVLPSGREVMALRIIPIPDEYIESFFEKPSLESLYSNVYTFSDFSYAIKGMKMVDDKYNMGIFETEEFQRIASEISQHYLEDENSEEVEEQLRKLGGSVGTVSEEPLSSDKEEDFFEMMSRDELKEFSKDNRTGILIKPESMMSTKALRDQLREWFAATQGGSEEIGTKTPPEDTKQEPQEESTASSMKDRLERLKSKVNN